MADNNGDDNNDVFVYMGGNQRVPRDVRYVRVHKSVKIITRRAFYYCYNLVSIEMHDGVEIIEDYAFCRCKSLRGIKLPGVRVIGAEAFFECTALADVEFGGKLETIGRSSFNGCTALRNIKIPKVRTIGNNAFTACWQLTDVELSKDLETIGHEAFINCHRLRRITLPLKANLLGSYVFIGCHILSQVDLVGGIYKTVSSLLLDSWRNEMNEEIDSIDRILPDAPADKTATVQQWMETVIERFEHYKSEHYALLKEFTTLLELALWKAKLDEDYHENECKTSKKAKIDTKAARQEQRITSGASVVIKNVLPFLKLE